MMINWLKKRSQVRDFVKSVLDKPLYEWDEIDHADPCISCYKNKLWRIDQISAFGSTSVYLYFDVDFIILGRKEEKALNSYASKLRQFRIKRHQSRIVENIIERLEQEKKEKIK